MKKALLFIILWIDILQVSKHSLYLQPTAPFNGAIPVTDNSNTGIIYIACVLTASMCYILFRIVDSLLKQNQDIAKAMDKMSDAVENSNKVMGVLVDDIAYLKAKDNNKS